MSTLRDVDRYRATIFYAKTDIEPRDDYQTLRATRKQDGEAFLAQLYQICMHQWSRIPESVQLIEQTGTFQLVFVIAIEQRHYVVRLNRLPLRCKAWEFYLDHWAYAEMARIGLPAPESLVVDLSRSHCSTDYHMMTYVDGMALNHFEDSVTQAMCPELLHAVGRYVARVHTIATVGFGPLGIHAIHDFSLARGIHVTWADYVLLRLDEHLILCKELGAITPAEMTHIQEIFNYHHDLLVCKNPVLLHGDLGNHNMLSRDGIRLDALIDWEDSMSGDPIFDIAFWGTFFKDHMLHDFLTGYQEIAGLPSDFIVRYWLYYLRIALSKTVHRARFGHIDRADRQPASRRIQKAFYKLISM